jgi:hypothetical protein
MRAESVAVNGMSRVFTLHPNQIGLQTNKNGREQL